VCCTAYYPWQAIQITTLHGVFSTLLGRHTVLKINVSARSAVYGPAPLTHSTPFIIECLFSVVTNSSYLWGLRFTSRPCYFPLFYSVTPSVCFMSLKEATAALIFISSYLLFYIPTNSEYFCSWKSLLTKNKLFWFYSVLRPSVFWFAIFDCFVKLYLTFQSKRMLNECEFDICQLPRKPFTSRTG